MNDEVRTGGYTGPRGSRVNGEGRNTDFRVRAPGSGGNGRNGNGSGGSNGGNIFSNFGDEIGRNPLGAVSNLFNNGINRPMADLYRGQGQAWQQAGRAAQNEGRAYQQFGRRDGARAAYGDGLYAEAEYGRAYQQAGRFNRQDRRDDRRDDRRPEYDRQQQGYGQGAPGNYGQAHPAPGIAQYYGQNPYGSVQTAPTGAVPPAPETLVPAPPPPPPAPPVVGATAPTPPAAPSTATGAAPAVPPATTGAAPASPPPAPATATLAAAEGGRAPRHGVRAQRAPRENEIPVIAANQVKPLQEMLLAAGLSIGPMRDDGKYGPLTNTAIRDFAATLTPPITDVTTIDFTNAADPEAQRFLTGLAARNPQNRAAAAAPAAPAPAGPTPEQLAAQQRAAAEAQARAQRAAEDQRVPEAIRNTPFDPRNLARMSQQERYDLARQALAGIDELRSENSRPGTERMHDKMDESVRWANEHLGTNIPRPAPTDPLSVDAMVALGLRVANRGGLSNDRSEIVNLPENMTQAAMDRAAVQYLRALDRGVSSEDPSRAIRRFEERDMGRSRIEVDGLADPEMLAALRQAVAVRNGLLDPNSIRVEPQTVATVVAPAAPAAVPTTVATAEVPPVSSTQIAGGQQSQGPEGAAPATPAAPPAAAAAVTR